MDIDGETLMDALLYVFISTEEQSTWIVWCVNSPVRKMSFSVLSELVLEVSSSH